MLIVDSLHASFLRPSSVDIGISPRRETLLTPWANCTSASTLLASIFSYCISVCASCPFCPLSPVTAPRTRVWLHLLFSLYQVFIHFQKIPLCTFSRPNRPSYLSHFLHKFCSHTLKIFMPFAGIHPLCPCLSCHCP